MSSDGGSEASPLIQRIRLWDPVVLAYLGLKPADPLLTLFAQVFTVLYFAFFLLMPWYSKIDKTKPVPERVTQ